jgi:hypothetical protein
MSFGKNNSSSNNSFNGTDTTNFSQTSTPSNPDWVTAALQGAVNKGTALAGQNPQSYVAGPDQLQTQAGGTAAALNGSPWNYNGAADLTRGVANAAAPVAKSVQALPYVQQYMDPYLKDVVNATAADLDYNDAKTRTAQTMDLARSGAFGGSRAGIAQAETEGQLERARGTTLGGLRSQGYTQALTAANADAERKQQAADLNAQLQAQQLDRSLTAANQLASLSSGYDANQRANAETQAGVGGTLQQIAQAKAQAPLSLESLYAQLLSGLPLSLLHGETDTGTQTETQQGTSKGNTSGFGFGVNFQKGK